MFLGFKYKIYVCILNIAVKTGGKQSSKLRKGYHMSVSITGNAPVEEKLAYVNYLESKYNRKLKSLDINIDGDFADLKYEFEQVPFERIHRITG